MLGLVVVLLLGQLLADVHTLEHQIQGESDGCSLCQLAGAPVLPGPPPSLGPSHTVPPVEFPAPALADPARRAPRDRHARAPPV
ncbi:MAG TPA: hypothetical protein VES73_07025 [Lamprocystis sp. (in: g-proteobacteria)]|nr:hypothetical protein [Lamprocystis sp. (in: g-proteobacteria)]